MAKIEVRCSDSEKEVWVQAAGGPRELSAWVRETLDARVSGDLVGPEAEPVVVFSGSLESGVESVSAPSEQDAYPSMSNPVAAVFGNRERQGCPRQHFHSPGQWCKTCGRTT